MGDDDLCALFEGERCVRIESELILGGRMLIFEFPDHRDKGLRYEPIEPSLHFYWPPRPLVDLQGVLEGSQEPLRITVSIWDCSVQTFTSVTVEMNPKAFSNI